MKAAGDSTAGLGQRHSRVKGLPAANGLGTTRHAHMHNMTFGPLGLATVKYPI
jgi:hypothetical protein